MKIEITGGLVSVPVYQDGKYLGSQKYTSQDGVIDVEDSTARILIKQKAARAVKPLKPLVKPSKKVSEKKENAEVVNEPLSPGRKRI